MVNYAYLVYFQNTLECQGYICVLRRLLASQCLHPLVVFGVTLG